MLPPERQVMPEPPRPGPSPVDSPEGGATCRAGVVRLRNAPLAGARHVPGARVERLPVHFSDGDNCRARHRALRDASARMGLLPLSNQSANGQVKSAYSIRQFKKALMSRSRTRTRWRRRTSSAVTASSRASELPGQGAVWALRVVSLLPLATEWCARTASIALV